jgi:hypothetical protein
MTVGESIHAYTIAEYLFSKVARSINPYNAFTIDLL